MQKFFSIRQIIALLCVALGFAQVAFGQCGTSSTSCTGFKTFSQGGYGGSNGCRGNGPANFLGANFSTAFPSGLEIGCGTRRIRLTSAIAVNNFLPSSGTPNMLPSGTMTNPTNYNNTLAGQLVTAKLNVGFDLAFSNFGSNSINLRNLVISFGTFSGWTVARLIEEADKKIGACPASSATFSQFNDALTRVNENYNGGTVNRGFLLCPNLTITGVRGAITCAGGTNGSINITVTGGRTPYTFAWSNGATTEDLSNLSAGNYTVTVSDAGGQVRTATFTLTNPTPIQISCSSTNGNCSTNVKGSVSVNVSNCSGFTILWSNGATTSTVNNLNPGTYTVTVRDNKGCTATCTTSIAALGCCNVTNAGTLTGEENNCGAYDAAPISGTEATGGIGSLVYAWYISANGTSWTLIDGANTASFDPGMVNATTYFKRTARRSTCSDEVSTNVIIKTVRSLPVLSCNAENGNCDNGNLGNVSVSVSGSSNFSILWSNGSDAANQTGLGAGTYSVTVTDNSGCQATCTTAVSVVACCNVTEAGTIAGNQSNCGPFDPAAISGTEANGGLNDLIYAWYESNNGTDWTLIAGANASSFDPGMLSSTTLYKRTARRAGCDSEVSSNVVTMTVNSLPVASVAGGVQNVRCNGASNGAINLTVSGNPAFTYAWNNGATTEDLSGLAPGSYNVTVTDANGCQATASATITEPSNLTIGGTTTPVASCVCNGTATATVSGGTEPYSYVWSTGFTGGAVLADLCRGAAPKVDVTDANGCKVSFTFNATGFQGGCNGTNIVDFYQGPRADGSPVDADRSNPELAKGAPENTNLPGSFYSLGFGGYVIVEINAGIYNRPGNDLRVVETTFWAWGCQRYTERARIFISADNVSWTDKGEICQDGEIDIWPLQCVRYVKIVDTSVPQSFVNEPILADGFDVDGIECIGNTFGRGAVASGSSVSEADEIAAAEAAARWITRTVSLMPNPAESMVNMELTGAKDGERVQMQIIDHVGRVVKTMEISTGAGLFRTEISLEGLSRGIYSVVVRGEELMYTQKLVKK